MGDLTTCCGGLRYSTSGKATGSERSAARPMHREDPKEDPITIYPVGGREPCLSAQADSSRRKSPNFENSLPNTMGLYSERFHSLLTLFAEFFSTFPHGTCSLSVLWIYLALDRVYDLLSAACSNNATLGEGPCPTDCTRTRV